MSSSSSWPWGSDTVGRSTGPCPDGAARRHASWEPKYPLTHDDRHVRKWRIARVPAERIAFGSDAPYGQPVEGLFLAMRAATYAGLSADDRALVAGGTMTAVLDGNEPPAATPPRLARVRPVAGSLVRVATYLMMGFSAALSAPPLPSRALSWIELARGVYRDPDPGGAGPALARIDNLRPLRLVRAARLVGVTLAGRQAAGPG